MNCVQCVESLLEISSTIHEYVYTNIFVQCTEQLVNQLSPYT